MDSVNQKFIDLFEELERKYDELTGFVESVEVMSDNKLFNHYLKQRKNIENVVLGFKKFKILNQDLIAGQELVAVEESESLRQELEKQNQETQKQIDELFENLKTLYLETKDKQNQKVKVEINSKDKLEFLFELIKKFAEQNGARVEVQKQNDKALSCYVYGEDIYQELVVLSGIVRVVENTKTFDSTVVVLDEKVFDETILEDDIEMKTSKSSGAGGQHINKTESAVKLLHVPTGITVECQDERSQTKNKERAMMLLKEKILQYYAKNNENYIKNQRNTIKNAIFSDTASIIFDFDKHKVIVSKLKKEYDIYSVLDGNLKSIANDMSV